MTATTSSDAGAEGIPPGSGLRERERLRRRAWWITGIYAAFAGLWIYFSDRVLATVVPEPDQLLQWSVYKGLAFVAVTSLLLLVLIRRAFRTIADGFAALEGRDRERELHQEEIERLNRLYAALSQVNQTIVRTSSLQELLERVCRALVEQGELASAWIQWHDQAEGEATPVAHWGSGGAAQKPSLVSLPGEEVEPWTHSRRAREYYICNDLLSDPDASVDQDEAERLGVRAFGSFPVRASGKTLGLLSVYARERDYFQDKEIALLEETATDIAFAVENLVREDARREAEAEAASERRFSEMLIQSMPGILCLYSAEGQFLRWNRNFETVSGYSRRELTEMDPMDFFPERDRGGLRKNMAEVFESGESSVEAPFVSRDGTETPYLLSGRRVTVDGRQCVVGMGVDISHRVRVEEERRVAVEALQELNQTLEAKVAERTRELKAALFEAESADRLKSAFLATMSHELRTPLNSIIGFTGILLQELAGPVNAEQRKQLEMVRGSARHLLALINDVLDLSKIEAGQLQLELTRFDLGELLNHAAETLRPLVLANGLDLQVRVPPGVGTIVGDRRRVEQILLNLLNNGIKFTDEGGVVLAAERNGKEVELIVTDTGIGIKSEDLAQLFQPFRQIDAGLNRQREGTGLGLAICQRLANLMNGEIRATSEWGRGSEFRVKIPVQPGS